MACVHEKWLQGAFNVFPRSPGEHLLLQEAGRSLSQNFVCAHVRLGRCYCRRPDGALTGGLKWRQRQLHWVEEGCPVDERMTFVDGGSESTGTGTEDV